jgi:hypothetical protein
LLKRNSHPKVLRLGGPQGSQLKLFSSVIVTQKQPYKYVIEWMWLSLQNCIYKTKGRLNLAHKSLIFCLLLQETNNYFGIKNENRYSVCGVHVGEGRVKGGD